MISWTKDTWSFTTIYSLRRYEIHIDLATISRYSDMVARFYAIVVDLERVMSSIREAAIADPQYEPSQESP